MPVSETANVSQSSGSRCTDSVIVPWSVNLAALESRLNSACRTFVRSARMLPRSSAHSTTSALPFFSTSGRTIAAQERGRVDREVVLACVKRRQGGKVRRQVGNDDLEDLFRLDQVLEAMPPQIEQAGVRG